MELKETALTEYTEYGTPKPEWKDDVNVITDQEMAKDIAMCIFKPYFDKYPEEDFDVWIQYIPSLGYYLIDINLHNTVFGCRVELVIDEKDGRVVNLWEFDEV